MDRGWVKLYRQITEWEWFTDPPTAHLFVYLLAAANREPTKYKGVEIPAGGLTTSRDALSKATGLSVKQVRTALDHLKRTGEVAIKTTNKYTLVIVNNWDNYQGDGQQRANNRPTIGQQSATNKNVRSKEVKKERKKPIYDACSVIQERYHSPKLIDAWMAFLEMRKLKKKPVSTERALTLLMKDLDRYGQTDDQKIAVLEQSVKNSWQGLYPLKGNDYGPNGSYTYRGAEYHSDYSNDIPWGDEGNV
ncbi:hypothetical protein [uncultured Allobaculum sp.]|uniref:hypothetical protein n=1 Tax=uncultured Allobaculum sp. TaxID=1187017 RepID=UPI002586BD7C|nr:hypothetical protein [uncultured Allobaculum sp.]